nr:reverse transcriptase domain-containing protein [Tanacetum cinerariifolium]
MSARPKTLDEAIELANDFMDQKLRTYAERQNDNKRKADDSSRNSQQQQPHKKQNVEAKDKSEEKRLEDVPIVNDFPEVFLEDFLGIPPTRQVEFQIDLVPGSAPVARAPYRGCTLNLLNHLFNIDLMPIELEKYVKKGFPIFLEHITTKEVEDKSEKKRLEDVLIVRNFLEVFPEDLSGLPLTQPVEFQIDLVPGVAPVARAPYRLAPSEMKELAE